MVATGTFAPASRQSDIIVPTLRIVRSAWNRMQTYVHSLDEAEINGHGYVRYSGGEFICDTVFITRQEVTVGSAKHSGFEFGRALYRAVRDERPDDLRLQWHSHPGEAYHSPTDMTQIEEAGAAGALWFISVVTNRAGDIVARLDQFRPFRVGVPMRVVVFDPPDPAVEAEVQAEVAELVTVVKPKKTRSRRSTQRSVAAVTK